MKMNTFVYHRVEQSLHTPGIPLIKEFKKLTRSKRRHLSSSLERNTPIAFSAAHSRPTVDSDLMESLASGRLWRHAMQRVPFKKVVSGRPTVAVGR